MRTAAGSLQVAGAQLAAAAIDILSSRVAHRGADAAGVFLSGTMPAGHHVTLRGSRRLATVDRRPLVVLVSQEGRELGRWLDIWADRVVEGVALQCESKAPCAIRLADGKVMFEFANRIEHHDGELVWGVHERDPQARARFQAWINELWRDKDARIEALLAES